MLLSQQISNSPKLKELNRTINIVGININSDISTFNIYYHITYTMNGQDVSNMFNVQVPNWHIDNSQLRYRRDENFKPIPNPNFKEKIYENSIVINENERYIMMPAFDYIKTLILDMNLPLKTIIAEYIVEEDKEGRFNF